MGRQRIRAASPGVRKVLANVSKKQRKVRPVKRPRCLAPGTALLAKLGSIAVHTDEMISTDGHHFDATAIRSLLNDVEIHEWLIAMTDLALVPRKRQPK